MVALFIVRVQLRKIENEQVIERFLQEHPEFEWDTTIKERMPEKLSPYIDEGQCTNFTALFCNRWLLYCLFKGRGCSIVETTVRKQKKNLETKKTINLLFTTS